MNKLKIPILDLSPEINVLWDELNTAFQTVLKTGQFIMGQSVAEFEEKVAAYLGVKHTISVNSGTDALVIGLRSLGIQQGDEVITTPFSFFATAEAISSIGATPIFVDIDPVTYNLDPKCVEAAITSRTRAILPVHLFGHSVDLDPLLEISERHGLKVLEDTAQALGGEYRGRKLGTLGHVGAFSFFPSKNLGAFGDAGLLSTNDDAIAERAKMLRVHGSRKKYENEMIGYNSRLDTIQAALLLVKLPLLDSWNQLRREAATFYNSLLSNFDGLVPPSEASFAFHVYHQYTIRLPSNKRHDIQERLFRSGIGTVVYYPYPIHKLSVYAQQKYSLPIAEQLSTEVLSLPIGPFITRDAQQEVVRVLLTAIT